MGRGTLAALLLALAGCQGGLGPVGPGTFSPEVQALAGRRAAPKLERQFGGTYSHPAFEARMAGIGERLALPEAGESCQCRFSLLASDQVNAFSLPGGLIYVTRGLCRRLGDDDELLAGVIAHEMSHILRHDSFKAACGTAEESLGREIDADAAAVGLLRTAGYEPLSLARLMDLTADVQPAGWAEARKAKLTAATPG